MPQSTAEDNYFNMLNGVLDLANFDNTENNGVGHFDDDPSRVIRRSNEHDHLHPRERIFRHIYEINYQQPIRRQ